MLGKAAVAGQAAPDFKVLDSGLKEVTLADFREKIKVIASVPSLDTPVCDLQIKRFNDEAAALSKDVVVIFISMDLPFAQKRFCQAYDIRKVKTFSDHREAVFGTAYGVLIKELRLLARAVFILDRSDIIRYVEYVEDMGAQPDYDAVLKTLKTLAA